MFTPLQKENQPPEQNPQGCIAYHNIYALVLSSYRVYLIPRVQIYASTKRRGRGLGAMTLAKQRIAQESQVTPKDGSSGKLSGTHYIRIIAVERTNDI